MTVRRPMMVVTVVVLGVFALTMAACGSGTDPTSSSSQPTSSTVTPQTAATMPSTTASAEQSTATAGASQLYPVSVDGRWGFIDNTGAIKIEPQFAAARGFSEGLAAVQVVTAGGTKSGYIDTSGTMVVEPRYDLAYDFSEGLAIVGNKTGHDGEGQAECGYIDRTGKLVIPIKYNIASGFAEGLAWFTLLEEDYPTYFIDKTGAIVLGPYHFVLDFSEGLAYAEKGDTYGYIDKTGRWVIELPRNLGRSSHSSSMFSDGLAGVQTSDERGRPLDGFIDTTGKLVIPAKFTGASDFSEGLAAAAVSKNDVMTWGYVDKTGAWAIEPQYGMARDFSEGLAAVTHISNGATAWGYIDKTGTMVVPPRQCLEAGPFVDGVAALKGLGDNSDPESLSYIDMTGKVIWQSR
jgi:hypothetical protein